ncbi:ribbon-helix-helix domain-containing protein [Caulobacter sp. UC70_42]|uniref:ribbon-helix-helix domain-containing protein n=1 Tax=Caulobacter sp. UC70_42 TaxID=3374551 RepID=UPI0037563B05
MAKGNALQAVLDRAKVGGEPAPAPAPATPAEAPPARGTQGARQGTKLIGGHFPPEISTQLRILAAEEGTTVQRLLAEALDDLFVKKGRNRVGRGVV